MGCSHLAQRESQSLHQASEVPLGPHQVPIHPSRYPSCSSLLKFLPFAEFSLVSIYDRSHQLPHPHSLPESRKCSPWQMSSER